MSADVVDEVRTASSSGLAVWLTTRTWSPPARADSLLVGAASTGRRPSLEEGAGATGT